MKSEQPTSYTKAFLLSTACGLAAVGLWSLLSFLELFPRSAFPSPRSVAVGLGEEFRTGRLADDLVASLFRVAAGYTLAVVLSIPLGLALGHRPGVRAALLPAVNFFRSLSPLAWIPFAILWFGIGDLPVVFLIFMATFFPLVLATLAAVANVPAVYFQVAHEYGFRGVELLTRITLPAIMPQVITALRVTGGMAWLVLVAAEMIAGRDGLGFAIWDARNGLRLDLLVCGMVVIGLTGVILDWLLSLLAKLPGVRWGYEH
ncbi:MAG: NitT/TauT family transport system permease protein [Acidobacteriota bacterium]|nr:NitT/TauT family transport system permease protein [Acidobacteriota bacterium]MDT7777756.1 NitT/TauT family transport system permease protein [Acidobacteriota bacterium]